MFLPKRPDAHLGVSVVQRRVWLSSNLSNSFGRTLCQLVKGKLYPPSTRFAKPDLHTCSFFSDDTAQAIAGLMI
jgi:hypothetical protein